MQKKIINISIIVSNIVYVHNERMKHLFYRSIILFYDHHKTFFYCNIIAKSVFVFFFKFQLFFHKSNFELG